MSKYYDDDDLYDEEAEDDLSPEEQQQMDDAIDRVKEILAGTSATPAQIRDAVWDSYFDVDQAVKALRDLLKKEDAKKKTAAQKSKVTAKQAEEISKSFKKPSPDDIISEAQKTQGGTAAANKKAGKAAKAGKALEKDMKALSIEEQPLPTVAVKQPKVDVVKEYGQTKRKPHVNFVVVGHVDAGKSTLMGRLMVDIGAIDERTINKYKHDADKLGKGSFAFAWVLDQSEEERERGVTIDVATNYFESPKVSFTILDAPGHKDFVPNMIAGASEADFAVLVIDSSPNAFESGFNQNGQTKEHALLVRSLGVQRIIVAVNKLDNVRWAEYRFAEIKEQMQAFLTSIGFAEGQASFVPCSGLAGDNIVRRSTEEELLAWYGDGPTLLDELENLRLVERDIKGSLRVSVTDVFKSSSSSLVNVTGRINSGNVQSGETVVVVPSMQTASVKTIMVSNDLRGWAVAGDNVQLGLSSIDLVHLRAGDVLCGLTSAPVRRARVFTARVILFQLRVPIIKGSNAIVYRGRSSQAVKITKLISVLDKASGKVSKSKPRHLVSGQSAVVEIEVEGKGCFPLETFKENKDLGRVVLRQDGNTIAAGIVEEVGAVLNEL